MAESKGSVRFVLASTAFGLVFVVYLPLALLFSAMWEWGEQLSYTLGRRMFLDVGLFFVPALSLLGYVDGVGWHRFSKAGVFAVLSALGLLAGATLAIAFYPMYPTAGPHELIASAFILPAVFVPCAAVSFPTPVKMSKRCVCGVFASAIIVVGCTISAFGTTAELALPLRLDGVERAELSDIQDFSNYSIRVRNVDQKAAARYAANLALPRSQAAYATPDTLPGFQAFTPPTEAQFWSKDFRRSEADTDQFPSGTSGCTESVAWAANVLYYFNQCEWGI